MLGEQLLSQGWISRETLELALAKQQNFGSQLGTNLLDIEAITEDQLMNALSADMHLPIARPKDLLGASPEALALLEPKLAIRAKALPFRIVGSTLDLATINATDLDLIDELAFAVGKRIRVFISHEARIAQALEKHYGHPTNARITNILDRIDRGPHRSHSKETKPAESADHGTASGDGPSEALDQRNSGQQHVGETGTSEQEIPPPKECPNQEESTEVVGDQAVPTIPLSMEELSSLDVASSELEVETAGTLGDQGTVRSERTAPNQAVQSVQVAGTVTPVVEKVTDAEGEALEGAASPDEIGDILLSILSPLFARIILLRNRKKVIVGWKGWGGDIDHVNLRGFATPEDEPSIFTNLQYGSGIYKGYLVASPAHERLSDCWGGGLRRECVLAPIKVRDRAVCIFYGDWVKSSAQRIDLDYVERLLAKAAMAFEMCIMRKKMRSR